MSVQPIDGSMGEGGGQILRTALSIAASLGKPIRVVNIRAGRSKPGLRPQHVKAIQAAAAICHAQTEGVFENSREILFQPQTTPQPGSYRFTIETAGAATLVLQSVLPPLCLAQDDSYIAVRGGTHVSWSPPFHYLLTVYLEALKALGFSANAELVAWGFYPRGGGEIRAEIAPSSEPTLEAAAWFQPRGPLCHIRILSAASGVGNQVAARQANQAFNRLAALGFQPLTSTKIVNPRSSGPGTCLYLEAEYEGGVRAGFSGFGRRGYPAERVADDAVDAFLRHHESRATVDPHLADQLILPLALIEHSKRRLSFTTSQITQHLLTNIRVVSQLMGPQFQVDGKEGEPGQVLCSN